MVASGHGYGEVVVVRADADFAVEPHPRDHEEKLCILGEPAVEELFDGAPQVFRQIAASWSAGMTGGA